MKLGDIMRSGKVAVLFSLLVVCGTAHGMVEKWKKNSLKFVVDNKEAFITGVVTGASMLGVGLLVGKKYFSNDGVPPVPSMKDFDNFKPKVLGKNKNVGEKENSSENLGKVKKRPEPKGNSQQNSLISELKKKQQNKKNQPPLENKKKAPPKPKKNKPKVPKKTLKISKQIQGAAGHKDG